MGNSEASTLEIIGEIPGYDKVIRKEADRQENKLDRYEEDEKKQEVAFPTLCHVGISSSPAPRGPDSFIEEVTRRFIHSNPDPIQRGVGFGHEIDAVSVRKTKNIASEVERKRMNRIILLFASSTGLPPSSGPGGTGAILIPNPCHLSHQST